MVTCGFLGIPGIPDIFSLWTLIFQFLTNLFVTPENNKKNHILVKIATILELGRKIAIDVSFESSCHADQFDVNFKCCLMKTKKWLHGLGHQILNLHMKITTFGLVIKSCQFRRAASFEDTFLEVWIKSVLKYKNNNCSDKFKKGQNFIIFTMQKGIICFTEYFSPVFSWPHFIFGNSASRFWTLSRMDTVAIPSLLWLFFSFSAFSIELSFSVFIRKL